MLWPHLRAARSTVAAGAVCFVLGVLTAAPTDSPAPVSQRSVRRLSAAIEAATTATTTRPLAPELAEARDVIAQVEAGVVVTVPAPTTVRPTPATTVPPTSSSSPSTSTTVAGPVEWVGPDPTTTEVAP